MSKKLIIVESPSKAVTIEKYLKTQGYRVIASKGHIRDLPKKELGIDIKNDFEIHDVTMEGKEAVIKLIKEAAKDADEIFLASDPDREGEKISQSISEILPKKKKVHRIKFNSVTKEAIEKALANPGKVDEKKCEAQKVRRILDRLVGYKISPILWNKIKSGLSAGRVQSVALRIIVEREDAIKVFVPQTWFTIIVKFEKEEIKFNSEYFGTNLKKREDLDKKEDADKVLASIKDKQYKIVNIETKEKEKKPTAPFTTSKMQQEAAGKLGFDAKKTMQVAQKLYEGVNIRGKGQTGLITYMRTDSVRVEPQAIDEVRKYIQGTYGDPYLPAKAIDYKDKKAGNVQDAHEAIRPTHIEDTPDSIKADLTQDEYELYNLIYQKFVASQMNNAILEETVVMLECEGYYFKTSGTITKFDGFKKAFADLAEEKKVKKGEEEEVEAVLPNLDQDELLTPIEPPKVYEKKTSPPPRFTEATLVKELEERGIGRPSTYAAIISNIMSRQYVEKEKTRFKPTDLGDQICRSLVQHFPNEMDVAFTANVEATLDEIEDGNVNWLEFVKEFWKNLEGALNKAMIEMKKTKVENLENSTEIKCTKCQDGEYLIRKGKNGEFLACSNYPACNSTQNFEKNEAGEIKITDKPAFKLNLVDKECPKCGSQMALRKSKAGNEFYSCSKYPECNGILPKDTTGIKCTKCNKGEIAPRMSKKNTKFWGCTNFPDCNNVYWNESDLPKPKEDTE